MSNVALERAESYLGYDIRAAAILSIDGDVVAVWIETPTGDRLRFSETVDDIYRSIAGSGVPRKDADFHAWLVQRGLSRARSAIALDRLQELGMQRFVYSPAEEEQRPEREIELIILRALRRLKRLSPGNTGDVPLDPAGISLNTGVPVDDIEYVAGRLRDRGWTETWGMGGGSSEIRDRITENGLQALEALESQSQGGGEDVEHREDLTYIPANTPYSAYLKLADLFRVANASVLILDPYVDAETLAPILTTAAKVPVRILTVNPSKDFATALARFQVEWGGTVEARVGPKTLHDRFLLVDDRLFFSGASFKDLGLRGSVVAEIRTDTVANAIKTDIESAWTAARPL